MRLTEYLNEAAARLSDDELICEFQCAERCALLSTRTRRDVALLRVCCLRRELERRALHVGQALSARPGDPLAG